MTGRPKTATPLWQSIAATMRAAIAEGQYPDGSRFPTESELAGRFGVNRHTIRHALSALIEDGLVHSRRGAGTFVLARPLDYPLGTRVRFHQNLHDAGRLPGRQLLSLEERPSSDAEAHRLKLKPGDAICVRHSLSLADGTPVALAEALYPSARLPGIADAMRSERSVTRALASIGVEDYRRSQTRMTATLADASQAAHLRVREGAPLLMTEAISFQDDLPVEVGQTWFASDRVTLTLDHLEP